MKTAQNGAFSAAVTQIRLRWRAFAGQPEDEARDSSFWIKEGDAQTEALFSFRDLGERGPRQRLALDRSTHQTVRLRSDRDSVIISD